MTTLEKVLYTARAHTTGGRDNGAARSDDGRLGGPTGPRVLAVIKADAYGHGAPAVAR